jgi:DNA-binding GntR family transcriptional regulator
MPKKQSAFLARPATRARGVAALSLHETAYERLKDALVTLVYKPGEYLNTAQVMERFDLGRTPINQALHRLSAEGLVQIIPRKGAVAAPLSIHDAIELIDVRLANEVLCLRLAAAAITNVELQQLAGISAEFEKAAAKQQTAALTNADRRFHELIARASRNVILQDILNVLHARAQRFWAISLSTTGHIEEVMQEHRAILAALQAHDVDAAGEAVRTHILSFRESLMRRPG